MNLSKMIIDRAIWPETIPDPKETDPEKKAKQKYKIAPYALEPQTIRRRNDITFLFGQVNPLQRRIHGIGRKIVLRTKAGAKKTVDGGLKCELSLEEGQFDAAGALLFGRKIYKDENGDAKCLFGQLRGGYLAGEGTEYIAKAQVQADDPTTELDESKDVTWKAEIITSGKFTQTAADGRTCVALADDAKFTIADPAYLDLDDIEVSAN